MKAKMVEGLRIMVIGSSRPIPHPATPNFKHYTHCKNCGVLLVHMGQADALTGEDVWHLYSDDLGVTWYTTCKQQSIDRWREVEERRMAGG